MRAAAGLLLIVHIRCCIADSTCSSEVGSCSGRQASLMQLKALGGQRKASLEVLASEALKSQASTSAKLSSFQKFVTEMIEKDAAGELTFSKELYDAVYQIHVFIDLLYDSAILAHNQDLGVIQTCGHVATTCQNQVFTPLVVAREAELSEYRKGNGTDHKDCRDRRETACRHQQGGCETYHTYRKNTDENRGYSQFMPDCANRDFQYGWEHRQSHDMNGYIDADELDSAGQNALGKMENCLNEMYDHWLYIPNAAEPPAVDGLWELYNTCMGNNCETLETECNNDQDDFEHISCFYAQYKAQHCSSYHTCLHCDNASCVTNCHGVEDRGIGRGADNETAERLTCLLNVLFGERNGTNSYEAPLWGYGPRANDTERANKLTLCKEGTYNTTFWNIKCNITVTDPIDCTSLPPQPCSADFYDFYTTPSNLFKLRTDTPHCGTMVTNEQQGINRCIDFCDECISPAVIDPFPDTCPES